MPADNLARLLDALTETSVYVIEEKTHGLLYLNRRCRDAGDGRAAPGVKCRDAWPQACGCCPLDALGDKESVRSVHFDPLLKTTVDVTANRILWDGRIPAVVVTATPRKLNFEEKQGIRKIEQMYAKSLVTIFDECLIVNLTADYYVNCHKDVIWSDMPGQNHFDAANRCYGRRTLHPDDVESFTASFSREAMLRLFSEGKKRISRRLRRLGPDGVCRMAEFTAVRLDRLDAEECWCVLVFRDIEEAYALEQQRTMEISQLATAARIAYQMLIAVNLTRNSYHMLEYARRFLARPADAGCFDEFLENELSTVHPDYQEEFIRTFSRASLLEAFARGSRVAAMEVPHRGEDGEYHWHFTQVVWVESSSTADVIEITLSRNIDEERRLREEVLEKERRAKQLLEEALQNAEKASRAKSDFLSRMSHDIRTPMNAIVGMTELARLHMGDEEKQKDYLRKIADSGAHLLALINEVLDMGKVESGAFRLEETEFDLRGLVRETVEMVRLAVEKRRQTLAVDICDDLHPHVVGDAVRLRQVLVNILENASKYTGEEGKIFFALEEREREEPQVGEYRFVIEDTGIGMNPEFLKHVFEPFSRADDSRISKVPGTGLGMTIVHNLVSMMGGSIQVESEYGRGSRFTVTLFLNRGDARADDALPCMPGAEQSFPGLRVLLVEDNELNRQIATEMLRLLGAVVESAEDGRQAVEAVRSHPPLYYDIVFMDVQMPNLNGYEATREIRNSGMERIRELPIIALTADAFAEDARLARLAGMSGHLAKPISIDQLKDALSRCRLRQRRPPGNGARKSDTQRSAHP